MSRFALIGLVAAGCFYTDPINQRPSLDIKQVNPGPVYRGDVLELEAVSNDPDGHDVFFTWRAYACTNELDCDVAPYAISKEPDPAFDIAEQRVDSSSAVLMIHIVLEGIDDFGATAKPPQELYVSLEDHAPTVDLYLSSAYGNVVDAPMTIFASVGDEDDDYTKANVTWQVFSPTSQPNVVFVDAQNVDQNIPMHVVYGKQFTSDGVGEFEIQVTADDLLGTPSSTTTKSIKVNVKDDQPPCLKQLTPLVATAPAAWPMSEPTLFQVHVVADDLNPYPTVDDGLGPLGPISFTWSLLAPGTSRQILSSVSGNTVALDPATYQPGDILELRVEIADRKPRTLMCADGIATCSVNTDTMCLQRQTWRVEVR